MPLLGDLSGDFTHILLLGGLILTNLVLVPLTPCTNFHLTCLTGVDGPAGIILDLPMEWIDSMDGL